MPDNRSQPPSGLKYGGTAIYVDGDVRRVLDFYDRAFGLATRHYDPALEYGDVESGGAIIGFASRATGKFLMGERYPESPDGKPHGVEIAFFVEDVEAAFRRAVDAEAAVLAEPKVMPWGQTVAYVGSIEGTIVGLCTPMPAR